MPRMETRVAAELGDDLDSDRGPRSSPALRRPGGVYITQAARIVGVSPSLVRSWENEGLVSPGRTESGYRVFAPNDIERLRQIRDLMHRDGLNAAGVRRVFGNSGNGTGPTRSVLAVGERIRASRRRKGLSLRAVASLTGLSPSAISAVERGHSAPTVGSLQRLAHAFETTVPSLLGRPNRIAASWFGQRNDRCCSRPRA